MSSKSVVFYFLTENIDPDKEKNEIQYLLEIGKVVIVTCTRPLIRIPRVKYIQLRPLDATRLKAYTYWSKICYLISQIGESKSDKYFYVRNVYTGNRIVRKLVNQIWRFKTGHIINSKLPTYDSLYFVPFKLYLFFRPLKQSRKYKRVVIHDSLVFRLNKYPHFVAHARKNKFITVANVKSWDNPFYSQLAVNADGFLVWSDAMIDDLVKVHSIKSKFMHVWGARPFFNFFENLSNFRQNRIPSNNPKTNQLAIGYAAAFCDELMGRHEIDLIKKIALFLQREAPQAKLLIRPYPILSPSFYSPLKACSNLEVVEIQGRCVEYNNGNQVSSLRLGTALERYQFLERCDAFLSVATSFTIEAGIFGLPIFHFYLNPEDCGAEYELEFFKRIIISDHLIKYFNGGLFFASNYETLAGQIKNLQMNRESSIQLAKKVLIQMGIPVTSNSWPRATEDVRQKFEKLVTQTKEFID